jgi:hypothetical protein
MTPTPLISRAEASAKGHRYRVTTPDKPDSAFIQRVCADMARIPGTEWSLVDTGGGLVEVWRIPLVFPEGGIDE